MSSGSTSAISVRRPDSCSISPHVRPAEEHRVLPRDSPENKSSAMNSTLPSSLRNSSTGLGIYSSRREYGSMRRLYRHPMAKPKEGKSQRNSHFICLMFHAIGVEYDEIRAARGRGDRDGLNTVDERRLRLSCTRSAALRGRRKSIVYANNLVHEDRAGGAARSVGYLPDANDR